MSVGDSGGNGSGGIDRRRVLVSMGALTAWPGAALAQRKGDGAERASSEARAASAASPAGAGRKFFTEREFATLDEIAEMIIPADEHSGGARAAKVAETLDRRIGESRDPTWRTSWREDLAEIDRLANEMFGKPFVRISEEQRLRLLRRISLNERSPKEPGEYAFGTIKWWVGETYYRTAIGIHDEMKYLGNVAQDEFAGTDVSEASATVPSSKQ